MSRNYNVRRADDLPDDDHEAIRQISGALYDGGEIEKRERKLWPERNCPPWMKKDPAATVRFRAAVLLHDHWDDQRMKDIKDGKLELSDITDEEIIGGLAELARGLGNAKRPAVQLAALKTLAEMRGLIRNSEATHISDDELETLLEEAQARRAERSGLRPVPADREQVAE